MKRHQLILIDGYNYLNQALTKEEVKGLDLPEIRTRFIDDLTNIISSTDAEIIVVFDGNRPVAPALKELAGGESRAGGSSSGDRLPIKLLFSGQFETADSVIERLAARNAEQRPVLVVTSDHALQRTVFRDGVSRRSVREFASDVRHSKSLNKERYKRKVFNFFEDHLSKEQFEKLERLRLGKASGPNDRSGPHEEEEDH